MSIKVLDHGFVELVDSMGSDLTVVNAARVSFGKRKNELSTGDHKLISYLAEHKHWSPFRHVQFQFHCKVPEAIARQWYKHVVGIAYSEAGAREIDHAWNEISMRYVDASNFEFYVPDGFRKQSEDNKQASTNEHVNLHVPMEVNGHTKILDGKNAVDLFNKNAIELYKAMVAQGVAKEQARCVLPLSVYTEFYWTVSLQGLVNFIKLRKHAGAQYEIRLYADALEKFVEQVVPVSYKALLGI